MGNTAFKNVRARVQAFRETIRLRFAMARTTYLALKLASAQQGNIQSALTALFGGFIVFIVGSALAGTVVANFATAGSNASLGSFTGAKGINDLGPLIFYIGLVVLGMAMMVFGGLGALNKGPLGFD